MRRPISVPVLVPDLFSFSLQLQVAVQLLLLLGGSLEAARVPRVLRRLAMRSDGSGTGTGRVYEES